MGGLVEPQTGVQECGEPKNKPSPSISIIGWLWVVPLHPYLGHERRLFLDKVTIRPSDLSEKNISATQIKVKWALWFDSGFYMQNHPQVNTIFQVPHGLRWSSGLRRVACGVRMGPAGTWHKKIGGARLEFEASNMPIWHSSFTWKNDVIEQKHGDIK